LASGRPRVSESGHNQSTARNGYGVFQKSDDEILNLASPYEARPNLITRKRADNTARGAQDSAKYKGLRS
jgi:hypothetical protein